MEEKKARINKESPTYKRDKDRELVKGIFKYHECPGGVLSFWFRAHKGDRPERYRMRDGEQIKVPLGVARHLNKSGKRVVHKYKMNEDGAPSRDIGEIVNRYAFQSLEFTDLGDAEEPRVAKIVTL